MVFDIFRRTPESNLNVRIPVDLHDRLRRYCFDQRMDIKDYVVQLLEANLPKDEPPSESTPTPSS